jgi:hypothetical protein
MSIKHMASWAAILTVALMEPALAGDPAPGPIAGVGLPALAIIGGVYWVGKKAFGRKE